MPRTGRGGRRTGTPGRLYGNRTDLAAATGLPYGEKQKLMQAVTQAPPIPTAAPTPPAGNPADAVADLQGYTPRPITPLTAPTQNPNEHLLTPPVQGIQRAPSPLVAAVGLLNSLGANVPPEVKALRAAAAAAQMNQGAQ